MRIKNIDLSHLSLTAWDVFKSLSWSGKESLILHSRKRSDKYATPLLICLLTQVYGTLNYKLEEPLESHLNYISACLTRMTTLEAAPFERLAGWFDSGVRLVESAEFVGADAGLLLPDAGEESGGII